MSLELKIEKLTEAVEALTAQLSSGATVEASAPAEEPKTETAAAKKKREAAEKKAAEAAAKAAEPEADDTEAAEALEQIVPLVKKIVASFKHGSDEQAVATAKIKAIFKDAGAAKAGDVTAEHAVSVLEQLTAVANGEDEADDGSESLI